MNLFCRIYKAHDILTSRRHAVPRQVFEEELQCSRATVKRLFDEMKAVLHAPIVYDHGQRGYRYSSDAYELPGLWFSAQEIHALLAVQQLLSNCGPGLLQGGLNRLELRLQELLRAGNVAQADLSRICIIAIAGRKYEHAHFLQVANAVLQRQRLHISYCARSHQSETQRDISPQRLTHYRDNWYLDAWCHQRNALRVFSLDRLVAVTVLDDAAIDIADDVLDEQLGTSYGIFSGQPTQMAVLRFTEDRARWVADEVWHPQQQARFLEDGRYELTIPYAHSQELEMDILRHMPHVEVLAPSSLRKQIIAHLHLAIEQHQ